MITLEDVIIGLVIMVVGGLVGGSIGWTIMNCIFHGSQATFEFWGWLLKGGWRDG